MNPYTDENTIRTFSKDVDKMSLIWHTDQEDRTVTVLEGKGWQLQRDNELPLTLNEGDNIFIPMGQIHRVIKGSTDLKLKIEK
jgi:quercetin dioxygenase-like cupin family protein